MNRTEDQLTELRRTLSQFAWETADKRARALAIHFAAITELAEKFKKETRKDLDQ